MTKEKGIPQIRFSGFTDTWEQRELGDMGRTYTGLSGKTKDDFGHGQARFVTYMNVFSNPICNSEMTEPIEIDSKQNEVEIGDVFFTTSSETPEEVGMSSVLLKKQGKTYLNSFCFGFRPSEKIDSYYLAYMLRSEAIREKIILLAQGISRYNISKNKVMEIAVSLPSLDEQAQIGQYFTHLDRLITLHQRKYDKLTKVKKAMLEKMFPKNGSLYPEIRFKGFTDAWEQRKFSELTEIRSASRVHKEEWQSSGVPFYRSSDVMAALNGTENEKAFISEELYEKLSAVSGKLEKGDILVTGGGSVGKPYIVPNNEPLYTKDADLLWVKNNEKLVPYFIYTFFFSPAFSDYLNSVSHVGTIAHYTITQLEETPITLPCVSEQQKIGDYFRNIDSLITLHQRKLEKLKNIKKACLEKMFV